ncbi:MAG TPA: hypothetical protein VN729_01240 [Ktedonobacteraceae bacterium]|nr:hypothetical protein [Ktedonobacteraceae bacterium]
MQLAKRAVHIRVAGRSEELTLAELSLQANATDTEIKHAIARYLDLPAHSLANHVIVHTSQAIIVRPEAIYG